MGPCFSIITMAIELLSYLLHGGTSYWKFITPIVGGKCDGLTANQFPNGDKFVPVKFVVNPFVTFMGKYENVLPFRTAV